MKLDEFKIGETFYWHAGFKYLCTDKGTRTISAIHIEYDKDPVWFEGPPYNVDEITLDENDIKSCYKNDMDMIADRIENLEKSYHPNFLSEDAFKMLKEKNYELYHSYGRKRMLTIDRVDKDGKIWTPYAVEKDKNKNWNIKIFELFSRDYSSMLEDDFVKLRRSTPEDLKNRSLKFNKK